MEQSKLLAAMADIGRIEKDKTNRHSGYDYVSEEAVKAACQSAFIGAGVMPEAVAVEVISDEWVEQKKGGHQNLVKARATITIAGGTYQGLGAGQDYGDKATMKAQTSAIREAMKNIFCIPSGVDPEEESHDAPASNPAPKIEAAELESLPKKSEAVVFWAKVRSIFSGGPYELSKEAQQDAVRNLLGVHGFESTTEMNSQQSAAILTELAATYGPEAPTDKEGAPF